MEHFYSSNSLQKKDLISTFISIRKGLLFTSVFMAVSAVFSQAMGIVRKCLLPVLLSVSSVSWPLGKSLRPRYHSFSLSFQEAIHTCL